MNRLRRAAFIVAGTLACASAGAATSPRTAASDAIWRELAAGPPAADHPYGPRPSRFRTYRVDLAPLIAGLSSAPDVPGRAGEGADLTLPLPDGRIERFRAVASSVLGAEVRRVHPDLRAYRAIGRDDRTLTARVEVTPFGVRAMVLTPQGVALVDPLERGRAGEVICYWLRDDARPAAPFDCGEIAAAATRAATSAAVSGSVGDQLKTYRFILMATGEYTQFLGGQAQALAQMTTAMNRVNAIFERDAALHFNVVQMMAFDDPATDPYLPGTGGALANRNGTVVDSIFGAGSYDMSQAISISAQYTGQAFRPTQCSPGSPLHSGVTGPTANQFIAHVMPHEIGHMVGATHTQDRTCNRSTTPVEPLSGLTIMSSLGGACPVDIQPFADPFMHVASIEQLDTVLASPAGCLDLSATGNTPPVVNAGPDYTIPRGTPFVLTGSGGDVDPGDALAYTWEQVDKAPTSGDLTLGPLFRWRPPTTAPSREVPALATVLAGTVDPLEKLATVDRLLHFRLVARDNHPGAGGHAWDEMVVTVSGTPFAVTSPNGGNTFFSNVPFAVTWNVGGGAVAPNVDILLSTDGGATWSPLLLNTLNDGFESVTALAAATRTTCRIKVEAAGNIFYDLSDADFTLVGDATGTEVTLLQSEAAAEGIVIRWRLADPARYDEVRVERADAEEGPWSVAAGERREDADATRFIDRDVVPGRIYYYRLEAHARDGQITTVGPIAVRAFDTPGALAITALVPNPTRSAMRIDYAIPRAGHVRLRILDVQGRTVATLCDEVQKAGRSQAIWTAGGTRGAASGLYFVRIDSGSGSVVRQAVVTR
jgi:hypothetical protein